MPKAPYYDRRWRKAREQYLRQHPLCAMCEREGYVEPATVLDHVEPHRGDHAKFWDPGNWQGLCKFHHDSTKQSAEKTGRERPITGLDGWPLP